MAVEIGSTEDCYVRLPGTNKKAIAVSNGGGPFDIIVQDQVSPIVDLYLFRNDGTFALAAPVAIGDKSFTAVDASAIAVGHVVCFQEGSHFMQALVLSKNVNVVNIDTPFDFAFTETGGCSHGIKNMNVDGSVTPQVFMVSPGNLDDGQRWDITRFIVNITDDAAMDDGKFGGIPALTNGIVIRALGERTQNIFNAKRNGDFGLRNYDTLYTDNTLGPAGLYGFRSRRTFNGQEKNGVVIRLEATTNDEFEVVVYDNLTALSSLEVIVQGHVVED